MNKKAKPKVFMSEVFLEPRIKCGCCRYNFQGRISDLEKEVNCPNCGNLNYIVKVPDSK